MSNADLEPFRTCLLDISQPLAKRTHAAFHLRTIGTLEAAGAIAEGKKLFQMEYIRIITFENSSLAI